MDNALWLEERRKGIGGSDIAAIMGLSPWKSAYQIYLEKKEEVKDWEGSDAMDWGKRMEPALRQWYSDQTGRAVRLPDKIMYHREYPFMLASLDGYTDDRRVVEIKTSRYGKDWGEPGTAQVPEYYALQVQHYLLVTGFPVADVVVSIGGSPPELYEVPEDLELQQLITEACQEFWQRVQDSNPPPITTYADAVQKFGKSIAEGIIFAPQEAISQVDELRAVRDEIKTLEGREEEIKGKLIIVLGEKGDVLVNSAGEVLVTYKISKGRRSLDNKLLEKEMPEIYFKYLRTGDPARRFLLK